MNRTQEKWLKISTLARAASDFTKIADDANILLQVFLNRTRPKDSSKIQIIGILDVNLNLEGLNGFDDEREWDCREPYLRVEYFYHTFADDSEETLVDGDDFPSKGYVILNANNSEGCFPIYTHGQEQITPRTFNDAELDLIEFLKEEDSELLEHALKELESKPDWDLMDMIDSMDSHLYTEWSERY